MFINTIQCLWKLSSWIKLSQHCVKFWVLICIHVLFIISCIKHVQHWLYLQLFFKFYSTIITVFSLMDVIVRLFEESILLEATINYCYVFIACFLFYFISGNNCINLWCYCTCKNIKDLFLGTSICTTNLRL